MIKGWEHLRFWKYDWPTIEAHLRVIGNISRNKYGYCIFPDPKNWFRALELTPYDKVRCLILGQDPYPTRGYANGLAFSVYPHVRPLPRSLRNIFKEYEADLGHSVPRTGDLSVWAEQGVLLLNTILTVEENKPLSHAGLGWEKLTYEITRSLSERDVAVLLMGRKAQEYAAAFDPRKVVSVGHPSPLSAQRGFFGSRPFSRVNEVLRGLDVPSIDWRLH